MAEPDFDGWGSTEWENWALDVFNLRRWATNPVADRPGLDKTQVDRVIEESTRELNGLLHQISITNTWLGRVATPWQSQSDSGGWIRTMLGTSNATGQQVSIEVGDLFWKQAAKVRQNYFAKKHWLRLLWLSQIDSAQGRVRVQFAHPLLKDDREAPIWGGGTKAKGVGRR